MREAAAEERFEDATRYRNRLHAIESLAQRQGADRRAVGTIDVIGLAVDGDRAAVQLFPLRDGRLIDRYAFHLENVEGQDRADDPRGLLPRVLHRRAERAAAADRPVRPDRHRGPGRLPLRAPRRGGRGAGAGARREEAPRRARRRERGAGAHARDDRRRAEAAAPDRGAREPARVAQPREPARAGRVLRHLEPAGPRHRRLDDGVRRRPAEEGALPVVHGAGGSTARTTSRRWGR